MIIRLYLQTLILAVLLLLVQSITGDFHKILDSHYFVELDNTNLKATTEFIDIFHTVVEIHQVISHQFLQAVSIEMKDERSINLLYTHLNVKSISPIRIIHREDSTLALDELNSVKAGLLTPHRLSQVDKVHKNLKLTGQGVFIGLIDSGIDYYHPALGGGFGPGFKVVAGYDFVGDDWNSNDPNSKLEPDNDPLDNCSEEGSIGTGHGTHVAGIIAGYDENHNFTGVAPGAKLGMWRIFSCQGSARNDLVIAALLKAFDAGVDIISMSIGSDSPWSAPYNIQSRIISMISARGVSVVTSAGNIGNRGSFTTSTPGNVDSAFSVASVNNEYISFDGFFIASGIPGQIGFNLVRGIDLDMFDGYLALSYEGIDIFTYDACRPEFISNNVQGKIALVRLGGCSIETKIFHLILKGAIEVVLYDNVDALPSTISLPNGTIPVGVILLQDGLMLSKLYSSKRREKIFLSFSTSKDHTLLKSKYAATASYFTSIGPTAELDFKPNIAAVGQLVYSALPRYLGNWGMKQGTSMACPYVAGSIALYLEHHGKNTTSRNKVHEKFQNFAFETSIHNNTSGYLDSPLIQGAGLIQVYDTIVETTHITPSQISFNDTFTIDYRIQNLTIKNYGAERVSYRIFNNASVSLSPLHPSIFGYARPGSVSRTFNYAKIEFSMDQLVLLPGQSQIVQVSVNPPNTDPLEHVMYGGFIQFQSLDNTTKDLHVPYFGVVGSQRDLPVLDESYYIALNNVTNTTYNAYESIAFNLESPREESLFIRFRLFSPTLVVKGELLLNRNNNTRDILGYAFPPLTYLQRDIFGIRNRRSPAIWSGHYITSLPYNILDYSEETVPEIPPDLYMPITAGNYSIKISALKQFGEMKNEQDWESFIIGPIIVK